jgi:NodT family efflux transporter outer membrane factor (OMF) lipoprotein
LLEKLMSFQYLRNPRSAAAVTVLLLLGACASAPPSAVPSSEPLIGGVVPARLDGAGGSATDEAMPATAPTSWQHLIQEARLRDVVSLALAHNRDLRLAALNIDAARAQYRITNAARWPTVTAGLGESVSRSSTAAGDSGDISRQLTTSLSITSWELDLWGRLGQLKDAALNSYLATEATRDGVQSALIAEVAQVWLTVRANKALAQLAQQTVDSRQRSLDVTQRRYSAGALSGLDMATAQAALETALGDRASAQTSLTQSLNALRLLVGADVPTDLLPQADTTADSVALAAVPGGLSSEVLLQRPDVKANYRLVQAALAKVGAARAALLPTITLTASAGSASQELGKLFSAGTGIWSIAPSLRLPLLDGGASSANVEVAEVNRLIEFTTYEQTVQTAFKEVADALAVRAQLDARLQAQGKLVDAYQRSLTLTERQYEAGSINALSVLDAQRSLYAAQQDLIALRLTEQANRLVLYKALGGA